jgi:antitoxin component HigA of HigAB toxin-antitoxin module
MPNLQPVRTEEDYDAALSEAERIHAAKPPTAEGERIDVSWLR